MRAKLHLDAVLCTFLAENLRMPRKYALTPGKIQFYTSVDRGIGSLKTGINLLMPYSAKMGVYGYFRNALGLSIFQHPLTEIQAKSSFEDLNLTFCFGSETVVTV